MNIDFLAFDSLHHLGERATHPLIRLVVRLPLSLLVAGPGLPPRRFAAISGVVGGFAALRIRRPPCGGTRPNAPSGASNCGF